MGNRAGAMGCLPHLRLLSQTATQDFPSGGKERPSRGRTAWDVTVPMRQNFDQQAGRTTGALGWFSRIKGLKLVLGGILFFVLLHNPVLATQSVAMAWNPSSGTNVMGYKVYYGVASRAYTSVIDVGNATNATISGLVEGVTYYFAATAYSILGLESQYSSEVSYTVPGATAARLQIRGAPAGQFVVTVAGQAGRAYQILATQDFKTWTAIGTATVPAGGSIDFTDTNAASFSRRFYRAQ